MRDTTSSYVIDFKCALDFGEGQLLTREIDHGEAYLFPNNEVNIEHLVATALVDIVPASPAIQAAAVRYAENGNGLSRISEIQIAGQVLRFPQ
jgi:hypothetical protein